MIGRLHHIGIGVRNLDAAVRYYGQVLGLQAERTVSWPGLSAAIVLVGEIAIELIEPLEASTLVAESLLALVREKGGGVHHLCLEVADLAEELSRLKALGVRLIDEVPRETEGGRIAWLQEDAGDGVMLELCERGYQIC
jgi:methylmalonyl-CoA/ethylmalonyl-CoA epimerase